MANIKTIKALNKSDLIRFAPAVATTAAYPGVSDRYEFVNTLKAIKILGDYGFVPVSASQPAARSADPRRTNEFNHHEIRLIESRAIGTKALSKVGDTVGQIRLLNSHNGRMGFQLHSGLYRLVCENGMVVPSDNHDGSLKIRHTTESDLVMEALRQVSESMSRIPAQIEHWKEIEINPIQSREFARRAAGLRFGETAQGYDTGVLLEARRDEDKGNDFWTVFNVIQENTVKGGLIGKNANGRAIRSKELVEMTANLQYNKDLWALGAEFVQEIA